MLAERGTTIFMSTHTLSVAEDVCTRLGIIHKGKLLAMGTLDELRQKADIAGKTLEDMFVALTGEENKISLWE